MFWGSGKAQAVRPIAAQGKTLAWKQADGVDADEAEFLGQIRRLLERTPSLQASQLKMIGLKRVKERFGPEWQHIADRADRIARNVIERNLEPGDIYASWGEDTYITVFARLNEQAARVKCYLIGEEIVRTLLGEEATGHVEVKTAVTRVDGRVDLEAVGSMATLFEGAEVINPLVPPPGQAPPKPKSSAPPSSRSAALTKPKSSAPATPKSRAPAKPKPEVALGDAEMSPDLVPIERDRPAPTGSVPVAVNVLARVDFVFRPMWDPTRNVIATYLCVPRVKLSDAAGAVGEASLAVAGDPDATARLDSATVARVKADLAAMAADSRRFIIAMPVHFETLSSAAQRRRCAAAIGAIPEPMKQYLVVEVIDVPAGVLKPRLMEVIAPLRLHCRAVSLQVAIGTIDFTQVRGIGISAVGADIAHLVKSEVILMQQMARFQRAAEKAEAVTFLHGAKTRSLVTAAVGAGFHYVDGDAVAATLARPERIVPFELADLYKPR